MLHALGVKYPNQNKQIITALAEIRTLMTDDEKRKDRNARKKNRR